MEKAKFVDKIVNSNIKKQIAVLTSKMDHGTLAIWATDCTEQVLSYFEVKNAKENRPMRAVEAGRAWVRGELL